MKNSMIPNIFTFLNLSFGILSLLATFDNKFLLSSIFILCAAFVDRYDGKIARLLNVSSDLGKELDSLADLVSFGVAPSILCYLQYNLRALEPTGIIGILLVLIFPICGAFRLARYNATAFSGVFTGIPITVAGSILSILVLFNGAAKISSYIISLFIIALSYLMISNIKLKKI